METTRKITHKTIKNGEVLVDSTNTEVTTIETGDNYHREITISKSESGENEFVSFKGVRHFSDNSYRDESYYITNESLVGNVSDVTDIDEGDYHITIEEHYYCIIEGNYLNNIPETLPEDSLILERVMVTSKSKNPSGIEYAATAVTECKTTEGMDEYNYMVSTHTLPTDTESPFGGKTQLIAVNSLEPGRTRVRLVCVTVPDDDSNPELLFAFENVGSKDSDPSAFISTHINYDQMDSVLNISITDLEDGNVYIELKNENVEIEVGVSLEEFKSRKVTDINGAIYLESNIGDDSRNTLELIGDSGFAKIEQIISLITWDKVIEKINDVLKYINNSEIANITFMFEDGEAHFDPDYIQA